MMALGLLVLLKLIESWGFRSYKIIYSPSAVRRAAELTVWSREHDYNLPRSGQGCRTPVELEPRIGPTNGSGKVDCLATGRKRFAFRTFPRISRHGEAL